MLFKPNQVFAYQINKTPLPNFINENFFLKIANRIRVILKTFCLTNLKTVVKIKKNEPN